MVKPHQEQEVMEHNFIIDSHEVGENGLSLEWSKELVEAVKQNEHCILVDCRVNKNGNEIIIFVVEVETPQRPAYDIRYKEKIAIEVVKDQRNGKRNLPRVYALREDFPRDTGHQLQTSFDYPRCLCIYEPSFEELELSFTFPKFLEDIGRWLSFAAYGKLHQETQGLETFLQSFDGTITLPREVLSNPHSQNELYVYAMPNSRTNVQLNLRAFTKKFESKLDNNYIPLILVGNPISHNIIGKQPTNFFDLEEMLGLVGINFRNEIKEFLLSKNAPQHYSKKLILILILPRKRNKSGDAETNDLYAILTQDSFGELGKKLSVWEEMEGNDFMGIIYSAKPKKEALADCGLLVLNPKFDFSRERAQIFNGIDKEGSLKNIFQIGVGALGSQIAINLARMGWGKWTFLDKDTLFPHNLARHTLDTIDIGLPKSRNLSLRINNMFGKQNHTKYLHDDFQYPEGRDDMSKALAEADVILDTSASVAVARELASCIETNARKISAFLNPKGTDLIIIAEAASKNLPLDALEYQYYREITYNNSLSEHLFNPDNIRYSNSCRDTSSRIPQDYVAMLAAIASNRVRSLVANDSAAVDIWQINENTMEVDVSKVPIYPIQTCLVEGWEVVLDKFVANKINDARIHKMPNETGGLLIGGYDIKRKKIYIVDVILSPSDSKEYPSAYYQGVDGLPEELDRIEQVTQNHLACLGKWHTHPPGHSLEMSKDDLVLLDWIAEDNKSRGLPPIMLIAGDNKSYKIHLQKRTNHEEK